MASRDAFLHEPNLSLGTPADNRLVDAEPEAPPTVPAVPAVVTTSQAVTG